MCMKMRWWNKFTVFVTDAAYTYIPSHVHYMAFRYAMPFEYKIFDLKSLLRWVACRKLCNQLHHLIGFIVFKFMSQFNWSSSCKWFKVYLNQNLNWTDDSSVKLPFNARGTILQIGWSRENNIPTSNKNCKKTTLILILHWD